MTRAETIRDEMALSIRRLAGTDLAAKVANGRVARLTGLSVATIERLRWKKIGRVPADVADAVREAMLEYTEKQEERARHEAAILRARLARHEDVDREAVLADRDDVGTSGASDRALAGD